MSLLEFMFKIGIYVILSVSFAVLILVVPVALSELLYRKRKRKQ